MKVKEKKQLTEYGTTFVFYMISIFLVYMMFMHPLMTSDYIPTYPLKDEVELLDLASLTSGGRFIVFFINRFHWLLAKMNITYFENAYIMQIMGIMLYSMSCTIVFYLIVDCFTDKKEIIFVKACVLFSMVNPCVVETFRYGAIDWSIGILITILSVRAIIKRQYILGVILGFCATSCYQSNCLILLIVSIGILCIRIDNNNIKENIKHIIYAIGITGVGALLNIGLQKCLLKFLFPSVVPVKDVAMSSNNLGEHLLKIFFEMKRILLEFYDMLPRNCLLYFGALLLIPAIIYLVIKKKYINSIMIALMFLAVIIVPFSFGIVTPVLWYAQRTMLSLFWGISLLIILILYQVRDCQVLKKYTYTIVSIFAIIVVFYTETCITDSYINQAVDKSEAISIHNEIVKYEEETGIKVDTIASRLSPGVNWENNSLLLRYNNITYNQRMVVDSWAQGGYINYINNTSYQCRGMTDDEFSQYFEDYRDWNSYIPSNQLHFEGNTLYWIIY